MTDWIMVTALVPLILAALGWVAWVTKSLVEVKTMLTLLTASNGFRKPFKRHLHAFDQREVKR